MLDIDQYFGDYTPPPFPNVSQPCVSFQGELDLLLCVLVLDSKPLVELLLPDAFLCQPPVTHTAHRQTRVPRAQTGPEPWVWQWREALT